MACSTQYAGAVLTCLFHDNIRLTPQCCYHLYSNPMVNLMYVTHVVQIPMGTIGFWEFLDRWILVESLMITDTC